MTIQLLTKEQVNSDLQQQLSQLYLELNAELDQLDLNSIFSAYGTTDIVICMDNNKLIGIAMMAKYKVISGHKGMIEDVVVAKTHRGKGIGRKLMEKLLDHAKSEQLQDILLFSGHHRTAAISLYKSLGFTLKESGLYIKKI
ncbi:phosphinothricin acetyltransferase [Maribacter sedimenticola]|uniref:Phosphinothricin acetyltransferase n=1 Tax=Maribacter sedimenticola TaxID=228956 RepID=A0ABY1SG98_9FLAO|nr:MULTISPECIES: GNAT family N-acetyltransferase [Maribacter]TVZ14396.1 phosphinothricin acetyltransferase [Maribacter sp. MAR_2009_72]SNR44810.1 phosphinothricin acetyltransferase [Maribacter sedimenticola]